MNNQSPNKLAGTQSPYLQQHAYNPVNWYPWGEEALARARDESKPILLSIGYSTCHWCHVMEQESFSDEIVAALMNQHFICIKVDREERPDLDKIYLRRIGHERIRRLAAQRFSNARPAALFRRHLFPSPSPAGHALLDRGPNEDRRTLVPI